MKPLLLTMQSFGSYGKKTVIDFTKPNQNLFLITGDTGSGKSTIFDAIVFALYGEASSGTSKKDGAELQSQYAGADSEPFVELTFSENKGAADEIYTVRRTPRHIRALKRGTGTKEEKETVSLFMPDGMEFSGNKKATDIKLEEIAGLSKEQFMQVAMIAQGEFMNVILSSSDEKKKTFRKLFNTEKFQKIVDELKRRKDEMNSQLDEIRAEFRVEAGHIVCPEICDDEKTQLYREISDLRERITSVGTVSFADMDILLPKLEEACEDLKNKTESADAAFSAAKVTRDSSVRVLTEAKTLQASFDNLEKSQQTLKECEEIAEEIEKGEKLAVKIAGAHEIANSYRVYERAKTDLENIRTRLEVQEKNLPELKCQEATFEENEKKARIEFDIAKKEYISVSEKVSRADALFDQIEQEQKHAQRLEKEFGKAKDKFEAAEDEVISLDKKENDWKQIVTERKEAREQFLLWKSRSERFVETESEIQNLEQLLRTIDSESKQSTIVQREYAEIKDLHLEKNADYMQKYNMFLDAQAGFIARETLKAGVPCPVCGSVEHPMPAQLSDEHRELTRDIIDRLSSEVSALNDRLQEKSEASGKIVQSLTEKKEQYKSRLTALGQELASRYNMDQQPDFDLEAAKLFCTQEKKTLHEEGQLLKKAVAELDSAEKNIENAKELRNELEHNRKVYENELNTLKSQQAICEEKIKTLSAQKTFETRNQAQEMLNEAKFANDKADKAHRMTIDNLQIAKSERERCETLIANAKADIPKREETCNECFFEYEALMKQKDLSFEEWTDISHKYDASYADQLNKASSDYRSKRAAAQGALETAEKSIGGKKRPDITEIQAAAAAAEKKMEDAGNNFDYIRRIYEDNCKVYSSLLPKMEKHRKAASDYTRIESMHSRLSGKVSGARMDIETFVQRYYLERILHAANKRFNVMTSGQYELRMTDIERAGEGKNRGLDLMVYSYVTASEREIKTLSGGEKFMAALALALGMSDQIQESAAGINLDMMFIDEGFGSLSDRSRSQAIRVLQDMADGDRLIGIISHVSELKQEIENQLIVRKNDEGSYISWSIS